MSPSSKPNSRVRQVATLTTLLAIGFATQIQAAQVKVSIRNLAPANGTYLTPLWVGFHNGSFDLFNSGSAASAGLERIAEDGNPAGLGMEFSASGMGSAQGVIIDTMAFPPFAPSKTGSMVFAVNPFDAKSRYLSFASMVIPSNDAFIGNGNPMMIEVFQPDGTFTGGTFIISGGMVWDAGTEVNDELPANTAFFGQMAPNTGMGENGVVMLHGGFNAPGSGGILDAAMFANADFRAQGYQLAEITVSAVPEPHEYALIAGLGLAGFAILRRRIRA